MTVGDSVVLAAWSAVSFGLVEGALLVWTRGMPRLHAPYKASNQLLWIAPLVDVVVFVAVAVLLPLAWRLLRRWTAGHENRLTAGAFLFLGMWTVLDTPGVLHPAASMVLGLGLAVATSRGLAGRERPLAAWLRGRTLWLPVLLAVAAAGVEGQRQWSERQALNRLPPVRPEP